MTDAETILELRAALAAKDQHLHEALKDRQAFRLEAQAWKERATDNAGENAALRAERDRTLRR
jgi:hypothetical protein